MAVAPAHQSRGLASGLLEHIVREAPTRNANAVSAPIGTIAITDANANTTTDTTTNTTTNTATVNTGNRNSEVAINDEDEVQPPGRVKLTLSTARAFNEEFYLRPGFRTVRTIRVEPGVYGSEMGFEIAGMEMVV